MRKQLLFFTFLLTLTVLFNACNDKSPVNKVVGIAQPAPQADFKEIMERGKLIVLAENTAISYFIYKGAKMGLEYEILKEFARHLNLELEVKVVKNLDEIQEMLMNGEGDIIACNYTMTKERMRKINFSHPIMRTSQVLVQRKPDDWRKLSKKELNKQLIRNPEQLAEKEVHVWKNSSYYKRLVNLQDELGDTIFTIPFDGDIIAEEAIQMVAEGLIDFTVTDRNVALINQRFHPNIDIDFSLSIKQRIGFGLRKSSPVLLEKLNTWLDHFMKTSTFRYIKHKYLNMSMFSKKAMDEYSSVSIGGGKISSFDEIIKLNAKEYNWDWRLLAAVIYQESKFKLNQESWAGAYGLMQFMPETGPTYGVYPDSPPEVQIAGGMKKLSKNLNDWEEIPDSIQRIKFALASYNAGLGHVYDAKRLAAAEGLDTLLWDDNVENMLLLLSKPKHYQSDLVRHGYLRGTETFNYVRQIFTRFNEYSTAFKE